MRGGAYAPLSANHMIALDISFVSPQQWVESLPAPPVEERHWKTLTEGAFKRDRHTCQACGAISKPSELHPHGGMVIHHRDDDPQNVAPNNLVTVCPLCWHVLHIGMAGVSGEEASAPGKLGLSAIPQQTISLVTMMAGVCARIDPSHPVSEQARTLHDEIRRDALANIKNEIPVWEDQSPTTLARYLKLLPKHKRERAKRLMPDIRFLPALGYSSHQRYFEAMSVQFSQVPLDRWHMVAKKTLDSVRSR